MGIQYFGIAKSIIEYDELVGYWKLKDVTSDKVFATSSAALRSLALGKHDWTVYNDTDCYGSESSLRLSLTSCEDDNFACGDGSCINLEQRCDGQTDCKDKTDEVIYDNDHDDDVEDFDDNDNK